MEKDETYVTKENPSVQDWLDYNEPFFESLKENSTEASLSFAPLTDFDTHAIVAGTDMEKYFERIKEIVGPLGETTLKLVHSEMDDAWHITINPLQESQLSS